MSLIAASIIWVCTSAPPSTTGFGDFLKSKTFVEGLRAYEMTLEPDKLEDLLSRREAETLVDGALRLMPRRESEIGTKFKELDEIFRMFRTHPYSLVAATQFVRALERLRTVALQLGLVATSKDKQTWDSLVTGVTLAQKVAARHAFILLIKADESNAARSHPVGMVKYHQRRRAEMKK